MAARAAIATPGRRQSRLGQFQPHPERHHQRLGNHDITATAGNAGFNAVTAGPNGAAASAVGTITAAGSVNNIVQATGGAADGLSARGGAATATGVATSNAGGLASTYVLATGGYGGGAGGAAHANATSTGSASVTTVNARAEADAGQGSIGVATAAARATGSAATGSQSATAISSQSGNALVEEVGATAGAPLAGTSLGEAATSYGGAAGAFNSTDAAFASAVALPAVSATNAIIAANPGIKSAFGALPVFFAIGELGASHTAAASGDQTATSSINLAVNLADLSPSGDLILGLYNPHGTDAAGVTGATLTVSGNGITPATFSIADFAGHGFKLGALSTTGTLDLTLTLQVQTTAAGAGFFGNIIVGDPSAHAHVTRLGWAGAEHWSMHPG